MNKRKICVVTGTRAEYGLLYWLMREIQEDPALELQLIVTGTHLSPEFGRTYREIERDGFSIDAKVEMLLSSDSPVGIAKSIGLGVIGFADALAALRPALMVVLGDRYEILAAAQAAMVFNIPLAHLHGGETTEGAIDEAIRHAVTKMSQLHFVSNEIYRRRVIQLGENPERVYCFGSPGDDRIHRMEYMELEDLEQSIGFSLTAKFFLVTYHPVTTEPASAEAAMRSLVKALLAFPEYKVLITKPNADTGGRVIGEVIDACVKEYPEQFFAVTSLGSLRYLSAMRLCTIVIGNSSSGLLEAPILGKMAVNIGDRQKGRLRAPSVIDCAESTMEIVAAMRLAISCSIEGAKQKKDYAKAPTNISQKIKEVLKHHSLDHIINKQFYDLKE